MKKSKGFKYSELRLTAKCKCGPVVAPLVGLPLLSRYLLSGKPYTFLGPT